MTSLTPGVVRMLTGFAILAFLCIGFYVVAWRLRRAGLRALATQRALAARAHLQTYTPQTGDRLWVDWTRHHGGGA